MSASLLQVKSHIGRDLLQSAQLFRHEHGVVWEYVANGLEYKDPGTKPTVVVKIDSKGKKIQISDNGSGMLLEDLQHYFKMHGENQNRKQGKPGRGFFGTGKSAAFGISNSLTLITVKNGKRTKVRLTKKDIEAQADGEEIPVKLLEVETDVSAPNGTLVEIEEIFLKTIDIGSIIRHIERHIAHWPDASVIVNNHECEFSEPDVGKELKFHTKGTEYEKLLGDSLLTIKVAKAPLEEDFRGIAILAEQVWHETTLAGCERKPFAEYLFGTFDVPALIKDVSGVPPFDMSRSMKLNPRNGIVAEILRFVGVNVEAVRKELEREDRERRRTEDQKKLETQGEKIADLINSHFKEWSAKLKSTMAKAGVGRDLMPARAPDETELSDLMFGNDFPAVIVGAEPNVDKPDTPVGPDPNPNPLMPQVENDPSAQEKLGRKGGQLEKKRSAGGFKVDFRNIGINEKRAKYDKDTRTIFINLEHPRIALEAKNSDGEISIENANFQRIAYEIAFTEYSIVLTQELSTAQFFFDPQDALVHLRQTIDDLSKAFATAWPQLAGN